MKRIREGLIAVGLGAMLLSASAFEIGGHHDTLNVLSRLQGDASRMRDQRVVSFCAWLPDLSADLDAAVLRVRVLVDPDDRRWGISSKCDTNSSHQMAVAQTYLHALAGGQVAPVRAAAVELVEHFRSAPPGEAEGTAKDMRLCALGFALHLLGDTFAHSRLNWLPWHGAGTESQLYETGRGHAEKGAEPDYMLRRTVDSKRHKGQRWEDWVGQVATAWQAPASAADGTQGIGRQAEKDVRKLDETRLYTELGEQHMTEQLLLAAPGWRVMPGEAWPMPSKSSPKSGPWCRQQLQRLGGSKGTLGLNLGDCHELWAGYLKQAVRIFRNQGVDPLDKSCRVVETNGRVEKPLLD